MTLFSSEVKSTKLSPQQLGYIRRTATTCVSVSLKFGAFKRLKKQPQSGESLPSPVLSNGSGYPGSVKPSLTNKESQAITWLSMMIPLFG
jgi:hypothetical protein